MPLPTSDFTWWWFVSSTCWQIYNLQYSFIIILIVWQVDRALPGACHNKLSPSTNVTTPVSLPPPDVTPKTWLPTPRGHRANRPPQAVRTQVKCPEFYTHKNRKNTGKEGWVWDRLDVGVFSIGFGRGVCWILIGAFVKALIFYDKNMIISFIYIICNSWFIFKTIIQILYIRTFFLNVCFYIKKL